MRVGIQSGTKANLALTVALATVAWCWPTSWAEEVTASHEGCGNSEGNREGDGQKDPRDRERIQIGFRIAPVRLNLEGLDREMVGLGSYLVNAAGGCNDCHTNPPYARGHNPFCGEPRQVNSEHYLAGGMHFGPFTSRNLTPENGLPAGRTYCEFRDQMRTGIDLDLEHPQISPLLQVMPWPNYQQLSERDLRAIYEYLRAIPPAEPGTPGPPGCPSGG